MSAQLACEGSAAAPNVDSIWRHTNGGLYLVIAITNLASIRPQYPETVVYINTVNHSLWSRPVSEWTRSMSLVSAAENKAFAAPCAVASLERP